MAKISQKNFQEPLLSVLFQKSGGKALEPVYFKEILSNVCALAGVEEDAYGMATGTDALQTHRWIGFAFRELRKEGLTCAPATRPKKGRWCLTEEGVRKARSLGASVPAPVDTDTEDSEEENTETPSPVSNVVRLPTMNRTYSSDPYFKTLAIEQTECFGSFSERSKTCAQCLLNADCVRQVWSIKSQLAVRLRSKKAEKGKAGKAPVAAKATAVQDESIEDLLNDLSGAESKSKTDRLVKNGWSIIEIQNETTCSTCGKDIPVGTEVAWGAGRGTNHIQCVKES